MLFIRRNPLRLQRGPFSSFFLRFKNIGYNYFLSFILRGGYRGISFIKWNNTNPIKILPPHQSASAFKQSIIWVFPVKPIVNFFKHNIPILNFAKSSLLPLSLSFFLPIAKALHKLPAISQNVALKESKVASWKQSC